MVKTRKGSAATVLLLLCSAGALAAGIHAGPPQDPAAKQPVVNHLNPVEQRREMVRVLRSIDGRMAEAGSVEAADRDQMLTLLRGIQAELATMDQRLKQIEVELSRANKAE